MVVIGAGFAGLAVARGLRHTPVDVVLVEANNFHTFQPLLYQVATAGLDADNVAYAVRGIFRRQRNVEVRMARVESVDVDRRVVTLDQGGSLEYDTLVVAAGAESTAFGVDGVEEHAFPLKRLEDALALRAHVLDRFEEANADPALVEDGALNVVVSGGGPTGVEMAGGLMELFTKVLQRDFPTLPVRQARVVLVELADRLLPPFSVESSDRARSTLSRRGVEVRTGVGVERVEPTRVHLTDGTVVAAHTVVWAAGVTASPLASSLGAPLGRGGRVTVDDDLTVPGHPEIFATGDVAAAMSDGEGPLPQVAQPAIQGGRHVARQIERRLAGLPTEPFRYHDKGLDGDDRPARRRRRLPERTPPLRLHRLGGVARSPPRVPDGLPQPGQRVHQLGLELHHLRPRQPAAGRVRAVRTQRPPPSPQWLTRSRLHRPPSGFRCWRR